MKEPLVKVYWRDTASDSGWRDFDKAVKEESIPCCSIGWLLRADRKEVILTPMRRLDCKRGNDMQTIPRGCVTAIRRIKEGR